jgi:hypothetical protein
MKHFEYMRLTILDMPEDDIEHYNLQAIATPDGFVYCKILKGMYGLPQASIIAMEFLKEHLSRNATL